jgi:plastocyanin
MNVMAALFMALLAGTAGQGETAQVVIGTDRLEPRVLQASTADRVTFVNRSGRVVHVEFGPDRGRHHVFQVPGEIWAVFHQPGPHVYAVHFETGPRRELRGVVEVGHVPERPSESPPTCTGVTVMGVCLEP